MAGQADMSKWHSIRPWHPRLSLSVREITSVSATLILSSLSSQTNISLILDGEDDHADDGTVALSSTSPHQIMSDALSVKVNGASWKLFLIRVDDEADEALIIIYGLMPGRQYDIELGVLPGEERVKGQIVTESRGRDNDTDANQDVPELTHLLSSSSQLNLVDPSPSPPSPSPPTTPTSTTHSHQTLEEYIASLQSTLSHLQNEHTTLLSSLKAARRDAQKSQSGLRSEISSLKKSSQKHSAGDARMRQKVRALEEAVKQAAKGREDVEAEREVVEADRKDQDVESEEREKQWEAVSRMAEEARKERLLRESEDNARLQVIRTELAAVEARLEKLKYRREKFEGKSGSEEEDEAAQDRDKESDGQQDGVSNSKGLIRDLEDRLREIQLEREHIEADPYGYIASNDDAPGPNTSTSTDSAASQTDQAEPVPRLNNGHHHGHHHHHSHNNFHHLPFAPRGKRHAPFGSHQHPQHQQHQHSHTHPHVHPRVQNHFTSPPAVRQVQQRSPAQQHFGARGATGMQAPGAGAGKRRAVEGTEGNGQSAQGSGSTLSSLAPPFEPSVVRIHGKEGMGQVRGSGVGPWFGASGSDR